MHEATSELFIENVGTPNASIEIARLVGKLEQTQDTPKTHAVRWSDGSAWTRMSGLWTLGKHPALSLLHVHACAAWERGGGCCGHACAGADADVVVVCALLQLENG